MLNLPYSLVIEATADPEFFGFYSTELEGFSGIGHSVEDCLYKARWGMEEHVELLDVNVPILLIPVRPGRNIAIIVEVAALNFRLKELGIHPAEQLNQRLMNLMSDNG